MATKTYAIVNGDKYYNRILIDENDVSNFVYPEDPDAILIEDEEGIYSVLETEDMKKQKSLIQEDPLSNLSLEQKQKIAEILNLQ